MFEPLRLTYRNQEVALAACSMAGVAAEQGMVPCLHSFGLRDLMLLYRTGIRYIAVTRGDCDQCERGRGAHLENLIPHLQDLLRAKGLASFEYVELLTPQFEHILRDAISTTNVEEKEPEPERRAFFRRAFDVVKDASATEDNIIDREGHWFEPVGTLLPSEAGQVQPYSPLIDAMLCTGCDACTKVCPHEAIKLDEAEQAVDIVYSIDAARCSGCGICQDACEDNAIQIEQWSVPAESVVKLSVYRCPACGAGYHLPQQQPVNERELCRICSKHNHYKNLHQVLD